MKTLKQGTSQRSKQNVTFVDTVEEKGLNPYARSYRPRASKFGLNPYARSYSADQEQDVSIGMQDAARILLTLKAQGEGN